MESLSNILAAFLVPSPGAGVRQFFRAVWLLFFFSILEPLRQKGLPLSTWDVILPGVSCLMLGLMYQVYLSIDLSHSYRLDISIKYFYSLGWWTGFIILLPIVFRAAAASLAMALAYIPEFVFLLGITLLFTLLIRQGRALWLRGRLRWFTPIFLLQLGLFTWYSTHFYGSPERVCKSVFHQPGVTPLLTGSDLSQIGITGHPFPYDAGYDPMAQRWFVTVKERKVGLWSHTDHPSDCSNSLLILDKNGNVLDRKCFFSVDDAIMPQNLVIDPELKIVVIYLVDRNVHHRVAAYSYNNNRLRLVAAKSFYDDEPNALSLDLHKHRVYLVLYNQDALDLWSAVLPAFAHPARYRHQDFYAGLDKPVLSSDGSRWLIPSHKGALFTFSTGNLHPMSSIKYWQPLSSACLMENKLFLTGYMTGLLIKANPQTGRSIMSSASERAPRFCSTDPEHGLVFVSGYTPGFVGIHRLTDLFEQSRIRTGEVTRSIHYIPDLRRLVVGSSCGLLLIDPQEVKQ